MKAVFAVALSGVMLAGCAKKEEAKQENLLTNNTSGNPLTAPVDYLGAVNKGRKAAINTIDQAGLTKAINIFYAQEDRFPRDLNELAQKQYIPAVPEPPPGMKFEYTAASGQLKIVPQ